MCTVTLLRTAGRAIRLACNRDESRRRPAALPPVVRRYGARQAILPIDPVSDGTWIAVNDAGVAMTLLNTYAEPAERLSTAARGVASRGTIIPGLLGHSSVAAATEAVRALEAAAYPPFRLVLVGADHAMADICSDGRHIRARDLFLGSEPVMFTSSGLGDAVVEEPRRALFDQWFTPGADRAARQDAFHRHTWPDRPHLSVCMSRPDARTVSLSVVEIDVAHARLTYLGETPDSDVLPVTMEIDRT